MPTATQPGKPPPPPLVPVVTQVAGQTGQKFKLVPSTKGFVPPVSLTTATVAQQLAQATRVRMGAPIGQQVKPTTTQPQGPGIVTHSGPQGINISQQQLYQAGIRQPLPPGTQLHITSTSKGLQLQPIQTITSTSTAGLVSPRMTVAQNLQLQAQAKLAPRVPSTTTSQQPQFAQSLQGKITTLGQLGALSNSNLLPTNSIQVQGTPQTSMIPAGQVSSQTTVAQQTMPIQATIIPTSLMGAQAGSVSAGQIMVQQQALSAAVGQGKGTVVGSSSVVNQQQQPVQARLVYQQADGQTNVTTSTVPANFIQVSCIL